MTHLTDEESLALGLGERAGAELERTDAAFDRVRQAMLEQIAISKIGESVLREKLYMGIGVLESVRKVLMADASNATMITFIASIRDDLGDQSPIA